ncbi:MAG: T9SS type A sorting domain-containing protein [Bacteroidales bacterium]
MKYQYIEFILFLTSILLAVDGNCQYVNNSVTEIEFLNNHNYDNKSSSRHLQFFEYWDENGKWEEIGPLTSSNNSTYDVGRLSTLCIDPVNDSIILVGSPNGGLYYTINKGDSWINAGLDRPKEIHNLDMFTPGIASIIIIHYNGKTWWIIATGDKDQNFNYSRGVIRSTDMGKNWDLINGSYPDNLHDNWYYIRKLANHPVDHNIMFAATSNGLYKSVNVLAEHPEDVSWSLILEVPPSINEGFFDLEFHSLNPDTLFLSREYRASKKVVGNEILWSTDGGIEWSLLPGSPSVLPVDSTFTHFLSIFEVSPANPDVLFIYLKGKKPTTPRYFHTHCKYAISQNSWIQLNTLKSAYGNGRNGYALSPVDDELLFCATIFTYSSSDGGYTWEKENDSLLRDGKPKNNPHVDVQELRFNKDGTEIWAATDGGPYMKEIGDTIWQNKVNNIGIAKVMRFDQSQAEPEYFLFGGWDVGTQLLKKEDNLWTQVGGGDGFGCVFDNEETGTLYTANYSGYSYVIRNKNYVDSSRYEMGNFWTSNLAINPLDHNIVYLSQGDQIKCSKDQGENWYTLVTADDLGLEPENYLLYDMHVAESNGNFLYIRVVPVNEGTHHFIFRTGNVHAPRHLIRWEDISPYPALEAWLSDLEVDGLNHEKIWISYNSLSSSKILEYNGEKWIDISGKLQDINSGVHSIVHLKGVDGGMFAGTSYGIYYKEGQSKDWILYKPGLPNIVPVDIKINYSASTILTGLDGRGLWETSLPDNYIAPFEESELQNSILVYPNPSDNYVLISYRLEPDVQKAKIEVTDISGRVCESRQLDSQKGLLLIVVQHWRQGIFVANLYSNDLSVGRYKFVVK